MIFLVVQVDRHPTVHSVEHDNLHRGQDAHDRIAHGSQRRADLVAVHVVLKVEDDTHAAEHQQNHQADHADGVQHASGLDARVKILLRLAVHKGRSVIK